MVELLRNIGIDYLLFSLLEGYVFCKFFQVVGGCKKFKWREIALLSLVNCIMSQTLPPLVYQLVGLIYMSVYVYFRDKMKIKDSVKIALLSSLYMLILEMIYSVLICFIFGIDSFEKSVYVVFFIMIPIRAVEISLLKIGGNK